MHRIPHPRRSTSPSPSPAGRQHGVVARGQLAAIGIGRGAIAHRVRSARLHRLHPGVYAVRRIAGEPQRILNDLSELGVVAD